MGLGPVGSSVRVRLTAGVTAIFALALSVAAFGLVRQLESALVNDIQVRNDVVSQALSKLIRTGTLDANSLDRSILAAELASPDQRAMVEEGFTDSLISVTGPGVDDLPGSSFLDRLGRLGSDVLPLFGKSVPDTLEPDRFAITRLNLTTSNGNPLVLSVASPLDGVQRTVARVRNGLFVAVPALVAMVGVMAWIMTGRTLKPVGLITARAQEISGSTLHERVPVPPTDDEIGRLARTMNAMLDRLEASADRQKRFVSDASHELRSPVTSIKLQLETGLLGGDRTDWEQVAKVVLAEDERLERLVTDLIALTRLEEGVRPAPVEVDLDEVIFDQTAGVFRVPLDRTGVGAGRVLGVPAELVSVVRNLVDNAVRHARTRVRLSLTQAVGAEGPPMVRLIVEDDGPGIAEDQRQAVFERFARLQEGRERDAGGSGLGLALTKRIVEAHGGRIVVDRSGLGGAAFIADFPAAP